MERERVSNPEVLPPLGAGPGVEVLGWRDLLSAIPQSAKLLARLIRDPRTPALPKILAGAVVLYAAMPIDIIPDVIPLVGQLDDVVIVFVAMDWLIRNTDDSILYEHWDGDPATLRAIRNTMDSFGFGVVRKISGLRKSRRDARVARDGAGTQ